jgi:hypothetical protein
VDKPGEFHQFAGSVPLFVLGLPCEGTEFLLGVLPLLRYALELHFETLARVLSHALLPANLETHPNVVCIAQSSMNRHRHHGITASVFVLPLTHRGTPGNTHTAQRPHARHARDGTGTLGTGEAHTCALGVYVRWPYSLTCDRQALTIRGVRHACAPARDLLRAGGATAWTKGKEEKASMQQTTMRVLSVADAATILGIAPRTGRRWLQTGRLAGQQMGTAWVIFCLAEHAASATQPVGPVLPQRVQPTPAMIRQRLRQLRHWLITVRNAGVGAHRVRGKCL